MTKHKPTQKLDTLDLLRLLDNQIGTDHPANQTAHQIIESVVAEMMLLREVEAAALLLADMVTAEGVNVELPTAASPILQVIRCRQ
jgi:hypothetical protein